MLDGSFVNAPNGDAIRLRPGASALLRRTYVGGGPVALRGGSLGAEASAFGRSTIALDARSGDAALRRCTFDGGTIRLAGEATRVRMHECRIEAGLRAAIDVRRWATLTITDSSVSEGFVGLRVAGAKVVGRGLRFARTDGSHPQRRRAIELVGGAEAVLEDVVVRGRECSIAGATREGLLVRDPRANGGAEVDTLPKVSVLVTSRSSLVAKDVRVEQRDVPALRARSESRVTWTGGAMWARAGPSSSPPVRRARSPAPRSVRAARWRFPARRSSSGCARKKSACPRAATS